MTDDVTGSPPPANVRTMKDLLEGKAAAMGETTFFYYRGEAYSYADLDARANAVANGLLATGVAPGDVVCVSLYNSPEYLYTLFALAKLGAVAAPIDTRFTGDTLAYVLSETDAETLILGPDTRSAYEEIGDRAGNIETEFFVGERGGEQPYRDFDRLLEGDRSTPPDVDVGAADTCSIHYVQRYVTDRPKGVVLPHFSYVNTGWESCRNLFDLAADDCVFTTLPFYSSYPIQVGVVGAMLTEAEFAFAKQFDPDRFWDQVRAYDATVFLYLGRMLSVLYNRDVDPADADTPTEFAVGHGFGFDTDENLIADFEERFDVTVLEGYGITPTATIATFNEPDDRKIGSVGRPVSYAEVEIVDENDWPVPAGETGEIVVRSTRTNTMMQGLYEQPAATVETTRNRWIHTDDIGYKDEDGYVYFVANRANSIRLGRVAGRISSLEVESVIDAHPDVRESTVLGVENELGDEEIKSVVVPEDDASLTPIDVCRHCERQLTYVKLPRYIEIRDELPRSSSGKVRIEELQDGGQTVGVWDRESGYELSR